MPLFHLFLNPKKLNMITYFLFLFVVFVGFCFTIYKASQFEDSCEIFY